MRTFPSLSLKPAKLVTRGLAFFPIFTKKQNHANTAPEQLSLGAATAPRTAGATGLFYISSMRYFTYIRDFSTNELLLNKGRREHTNHYRQTALTYRYGYLCVHRHMFMYRIIYRDKLYFK